MIRDHSRELLQLLLDVVSWEKTTSGDDLDDEARCSLELGRSVESVLKGQCRHESERLVMDDSEVTRGFECSQTNGIIVHIELPLTLTVYRVTEVAEHVVDLQELTEEGPV